jgi:spore maturation protein CgeB
MNILYLSKNYENYTGALYQQDVIKKLASKHTVDFYGPGYNSYNNTDDINDIIKKSEISPDIMILGHGWLRDTNSRPVKRMVHLDLTETKVPCVLIMNKEYTALEQKIAYADSQDIDLIFTHHHKAQQWSEKYNPSFVFWPFAVNSDQFRDYGKSNEYDLAFSGILQNPSPRIAKTQTDLRIQIQDELFYTISDLKLKLRPKYDNYSIFWRAKPTNKLTQIANRLIHAEKRLPKDKYFKLYNKSKMTLNTLSPVQLVGTRYYEAMASKSLVICQKSHLYDEYNLFEPGKHCVVFEDVDDFSDLFRYYATNHDERKKIITSAYDHVLENHTWNKRIDQMMSAIESYIF